MSGRSPGLSSRKFPYRLYRIKIETMAGAARREGLPRPFGRDGKWNDGKWNTGKCGPNDTGRCGAQPKLSFSANAP
jgi:hypothetical protein